MRERIEEIVIASDNKNQKILEELYNEMMSDIAFFEKKLRELRDAMGLSKELCDEVTTLITYINTLETYFNGIKSTRTFHFFKTDKMSDKDIAVLEQQVASVKAMRKQLDLPVNEAEKDKLSKLINDAGKLDYNVSRKRVWLRRCNFTLASVLAAGIVALGVLALMTPGVNIIAALVMVPTMILAALAFFYLRSPVTATTQLNMGGYPMSLSATVPSTAGALAAGFMGFSMIRKLPIMNKPREIAARNMQAATINMHTDQLIKNIKTLPNEEVKTFLLSVVDTADRLYNAGVGGKNQSKMQKGRMILCETAKIVEGTIPATAADVMAAKVNTSHTFSDLLNSQRNLSTFWKRTSASFDAVKGKLAIPKSISFREIAAMG